MTGIRAAVLVPIRLVQTVGPVMTMIRRTVGGSHSGQMAFPGGQFDGRRDGSLLDTALRESAEEVGLDPADARIIGALPERRTMSSAYVVTPFVALIPDPYGFRMEPFEVARIIDAPVAEFLDPAKRRMVEWAWRDSVFEVPSVDIDGEVVWGLSLGIIEDLLASPILREI
jgi:8-oxo-dGTP pyrophosphatase MutT (NUDIX family)